MDTIRMMRITYEPRWKRFKPPFWWIFRWAYVRVGFYYYQCNPVLAYSHLDGLNEIRFKNLKPIEESCVETTCLNLTKDVAAQSFDDAMRGVIAYHRNQ